MSFWLFKRPLPIPDYYRRERANVTRYIAEYALTEHYKLSNGLPGLYDTPIHAQITPETSLEEIHSIADSYAAKTAFGLYVATEAANVRDPRVLGRRVKAFLKAEL